MKSICSKVNGFVGFSLDIADGIFQDNCPTVGFSLDIADGIFQDNCPTVGFSLDIADGIFQDNCPTVGHILHKKRAEFRRGAFRHTVTM